MLGLTAHLEELRQRLWLCLIGLGIGMGFSLWKAGALIAQLVSPYQKAMENLGKKPALMAIAPAETFLVYTKVVIIFGLAYSSPWILYQLWRFVGAGLYSHEKKYIKWLAPFAAFLFLLGCLFFLKLGAPMAMAFFVGIDPGIDFVKSEFSFAEYIDFILAMMLVFGLAFQFPLALLFLDWMNILSVETLAQYRRHVILAIVVIAAILTPPDFISQIIMSIPLYLLFEMTLLIGRWCRKKK